MVDWLFLLLWLFSASAIYFTACVEIKIIVELMQPQESNYTAIIPFGWRLIELVIPPRNASCRRSAGSEPPFRSARINVFLPEFLIFIYYFTF